MSSSLTLLVEDEPAIADTICTALRLDGFTAASAGTAAAAFFRLADDVSPAIVDIRRFSYKPSEDHRPLSDRGRKVIYYAGQRLHLSAYEYGTLELLLDHPGQEF